MQIPNTDYRTIDSQRNKEAPSQRAPTGVFGSIGAFFRFVVRYVVRIFTDERIPTWNKVVLALLIGMIISPIDLIPDFIPGFGQIDDMAVGLLILDYLFSGMPFQIMTEMYPGDPERLITWQSWAHRMTQIVPRRIHRRVFRKTPRSK